MMNPATDSHRTERDVLVAQAVRTGGVPEVLVFRATRSKVIDGEVGDPIAREPWHEDDGESEREALARIGWQPIGEWTATNFGAVGEVTSL